MSYDPDEHYCDEDHVLNGCPQATDQPRGIIHAKVKTESMSPVAHVVAMRNYSEIRLEMAARDFVSSFPPSKPARFR